MFDTRTRRIEVPGACGPPGHAGAVGAQFDASGQRPTHLSRADMEFLDFLIILWAAWLIWRRPERERLAFRLLVIACVLMALLFLVGTHGSLVPGVNL